MRAVYVGDVDLVDNRRAHAIQMLKNAQAWARAVPDFEMLTVVEPRHWWRCHWHGLADYYGLEQPFSLVGLPVAQWLKSDHALLRRLFPWLVARRCARRRVDLIFARNYAVAGPALDRGLAVLVETHSPPGADPEQRLLDERLDDPNLLGVVTISAALARRYRAAGYPADRLLVAPDGVDLERFADPLDRTTARIRLGLDPRRPLAVYAGHLYAGRGIEEILVAARIRQDMDFLLVGGFPGDVKKWRDRAAGEGLGNVTLAGFVANASLPPYLWAADCLLMPYGTGCPTADWMSPLKMFEYLAAGRVLVATDLPALREVLRHGENALLVPPDDGPALARALGEILAAPERAAALAAQGLADVVPFSWDQRVARILEFARQRRPDLG
ncbi:MAG: glycosyltransferase family 4 protein [Magnetococcales bacterium]|nr:glycosyltransferase family 4 protein [Magnetococcales bacterium]